MATGERIHRDIFVGVGAVVFRGEGAATEVLIVKRGKSPFKNLWSIPGGALEFGEELKDAVVREVREETSVEIDILGLIDVFEGFDRGSKDGPPRAEGFQRHTLMIDYVAEWRSGEPVAGDDAAAAEFAPLEEAKKRMSWDLTRQAIDRAHRLRLKAGRGGAAKTL